MNARLSLRQAQRLGLTLLWLCTLSLLLSPLQAQDRDLRLVPKTGPLAGKPVYGASYALLVGINRYANLPRAMWLEYAVRDVTDLRDVLIRSYGFPADHVRVLTDAEATKGNVEDALSDLADKSRVHGEDRVLVFFSGHGQTVATADGGDQGFLIPYDAKVDLDDITNAGPFLRTCVRMDTVWGFLDSSPAKHDLVLADACYSGLMASSRALSTIKPGVLAQMISLRAMQVMTAGTKGQKSREYPNLGHGAFTYKLLEQLKARATTPGDVFTTSDLYAKVCAGVLDLTDGSQYPKLGAHNATEGDFLFITTPAQPVPPLELVAPVPPPPARVPAAPLIAVVPTPPIVRAPPVVPAPASPEINAAFVARWAGGRGRKPAAEFLALTLDMLQQSLDLGADIEARDPDGNTALIAASRWGTPAMVTLLLGRGADVNAANKKNDTALIEATRGGRPEAVRLLLAGGADVNAKNKKGDTALAQARDFPDIAALLKNAGAVEPKKTSRPAVTFDFSLHGRQKRQENHGSH